MCFLCSRLCSKCLLCVCVRSVAQSRLTLCDPMDGSPPGSIVHGNFQARMPEQVTVSNLCLLHLQVDSLPLSYMGSPSKCFL